MKENKENDTSVGVPNAIHDDDRRRQLHDLRRCLCERMASQEDGIVPLPIIKVDSRLAANNAIAQFIEWCFREDRDDPFVQAGKHGDRCERCNYTRHPCDAFAASDAAINEIVSLREKLKNFDALLLRTIEQRDEQGELFDEAIEWIEWLQAIGLQTEYIGTKGSTQSEMHTLNEFVKKHRRKNDGV